MADLIKKFLLSIDMTRNTLSNVKIHPVGTLQRLALGADLSTTHEGLTVFDTDIHQLYVWTGTEWAPSGSQWSTEDW